MRDYNDLRLAIVHFLKESQIDAYDLVRVAKNLCNCGTCKFFVQHYSKDGKPVDFGHCCKGNIPKSKKPSMSNCGFWELDEEAKEG